MATTYQITQWRKRLERKGWISLRRSKPPSGQWIEYHVVYNGILYSGRCQREAFDVETHKPPHPAFFFFRDDKIQEVVWRKCRPGEPEKLIRCIGQLG